MTGVEFLEKAMPLFPTAKRALLTAYADTDAAIRAINTAHIDYYLMKPWDPPEELPLPGARRPAGRLAGELPAAVRGHPRARPPLVARRLPDPRLPGPQPGALPLAGRRGATRRPRAVPGGEDGGRRRESAAGRAPRRHPPGQPVARRAGGEDRPAHAGGEAVLRPGDRRRRPVRPGRRGLRRLRGAAHADGRAGRAGRAGGDQLADRELPRLPLRPLRRRPDPPRRHPGRSASASRS